jgi:peptidoglycan/LPS O-acetylase OafA/YrhL
LVNQNTQKSKEHFIALEWLRFFLGVYIVLFHTFHYDGLPSWVRKVTEMGFFSTSTFFVLSGFLLAHVYLRNHTSENVSMREPAKSFLIKRFSNLYPIHIGSLIITLIIVSILPFFNITDGDAEASMRFVVYDVNNHTSYEDLKYWMSDSELFIAFIMNAFMLQSWNPYYLTFNAPAWSVSTLFFLYFLFPYIATKLHKIKRPLMAIGIVNILYLIPVVLVILYSDFGMPETGILHRNPIIRLPEFAAGILLCSFYHKRKLVKQSLSITNVVFLISLILFSLYGASYFLSIAPEISSKGNAPYYLLHDGLLLPAQLSLIYLFLFIKLPDNKNFEKISTRFGSCSLPMFAMHVPLYLVFLRVQKILTGEPSLCLANFRACMDAAGSKNIFAYPIYLIITIIFCMFFQEKFVIKFRHIIQNIFLNKPMVK